MRPETGAHDARTGRQPSDLELVRGIATGREEDFRVLFARWAPKLGRFLLQVTGSRETAEDLLQEAFLRILRAAPRFEPRGKVSAWMYRICTNLAYSHWRRRRAAPFREMWDPDAMLATPAPAAQGPEHMRRKRAIADAARTALLQIPENQRLVFILKIDQGLTYQQIGEALHCPVGTAKSRFHHAIRRMRRLLQDWDDTPAGPSHRATRANGRDNDVL